MFWEILARQVSEMKGQGGWDLAAQRQKLRPQLSALERHQGQRWELWVWNPILRVTWGCPLHVSSLLLAGSMALETGRLASRPRLRDLGLSLSLSKTHVFSVKWDCGWTLS